MKAVVVFHGDCDGVISAGLYIRRFLADYYPKNLVLRFTQPWRAAKDVESATKSVESEGVDHLVILDVALNPELVNVLREIARSGTRITIIDHHISSQNLVEEVKQFARVAWIPTVSTPAVLVETMIKNLNKYEELLVNVANVCEGSETNDETVKGIADCIKLALAIDPTDTTTFCEAVKSIVEGKEFWRSPEFEAKYRRGKVLLNMLVNTIARRAREVCGWVIVSFTHAQSLAYAGLFGIASSEYTKRHRKPLILIRGEEGKIVVTVRSPEGKALELCEYISRTLNAPFYGGHREAASLTIYGEEDVDNIARKLEEVVRSFERC